MFSPRKKLMRCSICGVDIPHGCGLKYRMKVKRYSPDGFYCNMPCNGAVCPDCLMTLKQMVLEYKNYGATPKEVNVG